MSATTNNCPQALTAMLFVWLLATERVDMHGRVKGWLVSQAIDWES